MRKSILLGAAVAALALAGVVQAGTYTFSYVQTGGAAESGSGTFVTGPAGSPFTILSVNGTANGDTITGLSTYAGADNLLYVPAPNADFSGISFSTATLGNFNIYDQGDSSPLYLLNSVENPGGGPDLLHPITLTVTAVPEPVSWALMLVGIGGLGVALRRRNSLARHTA